MLRTALAVALAIGAGCAEPASPDPARSGSPSGSKSASVPASGSGSVPASGSALEADSASRSGAVRAPRFRVPDVRTRVRAAGNLAALPERLRAAFAPATPAFTAIVPPLPGDWLAEHVEPGQTYDQFVAARPHRANRHRGVVYLVAIGELAGPAAPDLERLAEFTRAHLGLPVRLLDPVPASATGARSRAPGGIHQLHAPDLLAHLRSLLPVDAYALLGVTTIDLYPDDRWSFVFGMASFRERVGVYSVARHHPAFHGEADHHPAPERWVLRRSLKVLVHELGHIAGMEHCVYYECVMNGSNHLEETDRRPVHLCPVCLRKLHHAVGFDPADRYAALSRVFRRAGLGPEADWTAARAAAIAALRAPP